MATEQIQPSLHKVTCDRCGASVEFEGGTVPEGWARYLKQFVPAMSEMIDLCADCTAAFSSWMAREGR